MSRCLRCDAPQCMWDFSKCSNCGLPCGMYNDERNNKNYPDIRTPEEIQQDGIDRAEELGEPFDIDE